MTPVKKIIYKIANEAESGLDLLKLKLREKLGFSLSVQVCPYNTYGTIDNIYLRGRVMHDRSIVSDDNDSFTRNLLNTYKRLASVEIAGAKLKASCGDTELFFTTDEDGYFEFPLKLNIPLPGEQLWHTPLLELIECPVRFEKPLFKRANVMVPPVTSQFGVISDIDDTILPTHSDSVWKMAIETFSKNHFNRFPFRGISSFYNSLHRGISGESFNPFFYVSSSPWNLYDLLSDFFKLNKIPAGPLLLKDYGFTHGKLFSESHQKHKLKMIRNILNTYPQLPFILAGDSAQKDPEIYNEAIKEFPGRILAIYIRDVSLGKREVEIKMISEKLINGAVEMVICENTLTAASHAVTKGFIRKSDLDFISLEVNNNS